MKLVMTLLVRDEQDIIAANIDFHRSQGVDMFIVTDNLSNDETPSILRKYEKKGYLKIIRETSDDYSQHQWVTRMAKMAFLEYHADWIINNDADEFWMPDITSYNIKQVLEKIPKSILACKAKRVNFLPPIGSTENMFFADSMIIRETKSFNAIGQPLPPKICHRGFKDILVKQGNHHVERNGKRLDAFELPLSILHYPLRSFSQFENKIKKGGSAYERNTSLDKSIGSTWRDLYKQHLKGKLQEYYTKQIPDKKELLEGLSANIFTKDERLIKYFLHNLDYAKLLSSKYK